MKTLLTPTPLIAVEVPVDSSKYKITTNGRLIYNKWFIACEIDPRSEIIGTVDKGVIDFDCEPYVEEIDLYLWTPVRNYEDDMDPFEEGDYSGSFLSLMQSHSLPLDKKYLIIKPKN